MASKGYWPEAVEMGGVRMLYTIAPVAQGIEHRFPKAGVARSNPAGGVSSRENRTPEPSLPFAIVAWILVTVTSGQRFKTNSYV